jgi:hypothetical protein
MVRILRVIVFTMVCLLIVLGYASADSDGDNESASPCTDCGLKAGDLALMDMIQISTGPGLSSVGGGDLEGEWAFFCEDSGYDGGYDPGFIGTGTAGGSGIPMDILIRGLTSIPGWNTPRTYIPKKSVYTPPVSAHPDTYIPPPSGFTCSYGSCDCSNYAKYCPTAKLPNSGVPAEWGRACCGAFSWNQGFR